MDNYSIIENIILNNKVSHALLFEVDNCNDFLPSLKKIVKLILCSKKNKCFNNLNCDECNICKLIDDDNYPDFKIISTDSNWIKKQQLVDLKEDFSNKSLLNNKKIYVIFEADKLNASSSNSLLKFLEEPEDDIIAILLTTNRYLLLDTIISRCQVYNFKKSDFSVNNDYIDKIEDFLDIVISNKNLFINYKYLFEEVFIDKQNSIVLLSEIEKYLLSFLNYNNECNLSRKLKDYDLNKIVILVKIIENYKQKLEFNVNFKIWLDSFFSKLIGDLYD